MILVLAVDRPLLDSLASPLAAAAATTWAAWSGKYQMLPFPLAPSSFMEMEDGDAEVGGIDAVSASSEEQLAVRMSTSLPVLFRRNTFRLPLSSLILTAVTKSELARRSFANSEFLRGSPSLIGRRKLGRR